MPPASQCCSSRLLVRHTGYWRNWPSFPLLPARERSSAILVRRCSEDLLMAGDRSPVTSSRAGFTTDRPRTAAKNRTVRMAATPPTRKDSDPPVPCGEAAFRFLLPPADDDEIGRLGNRWDAKDQSAAGPKAATGLESGDPTPLSPPPPGRGCRSRRSQWSNSAWSAPSRSRFATAWTGSRPVRPRRPDCLR